MRLAFLAPAKSLTEKMRWESLCDAFWGEYSIFLRQRVAGSWLVFLAWLVWHHYLGFLGFDISGCVEGWGGLCCHDQELFHHCNALVGMAQGNHGRLAYEKEILLCDWPRKSKQFPEELRRSMKTGALWEKVSQFFPVMVRRQAEKYVDMLYKMLFLLTKRGRKVYLCILWSLTSFQVALWWGPYSNLSRQMTQFAAWALEETPWPDSQRKIVDMESAGWSLPFVHTCMQQHNEIRQVTT